MVSITTVLFSFLFLPATTVFSDLASDRAALIALRDSVGGRVRLWNLTDVNKPCSWAGVICSADKSTVVELHLPGMGFAGVLRPNTISNLTNLQTLSLRYNSLSGPFPYDISRLIKLRNLYLQHNLFIGPLPDSIFSLTGLVRLNLAEHNFSGQLSPSFNNFTQLGTLYLESNSFSGPFSDLNLPDLVQFNVSNNQLSGPIPRAIAVKEPKSAFEGTSLCGQPLNDLCDNRVGNEGKKKKKGLSGVQLLGLL